MEPAHPMTVNNWPLKEKQVPTLMNTKSEYL